MRALTISLLLLCGCSGERAAPRPIRVLHTFGAAETELFNAAMVERGIAVESMQVPFSRGQHVIGELLRAGTACPDVIRIDATWLPELVDAKLLRPVPGELTALDWSPLAEALGRAGTPAAWWGVPQATDGLMVVRDAHTPAPAAPTIAALTATGASIGVRVDGYWLVPWLRADGVSLTGDGADALAGIDGPGAVHALDSFAALFRAPAAPPPAAGDEPPEELRRWRAHSIVYWITGPWQLGALTPAERDAVIVSPLTHAPRGGQLLVVPTCAPHPDDGWRIARELSDPAMQLAFATAFATIPTRLGAIAAAPAIVKDEYAALQAAEPLPRAAWTPLLFDDLNPALAAVVAGDATADEAIGGVRKAWRKLTGGAP